MAEHEGGHFRHYIHQNKRGFEALLRGVRPGECPVRSRVGERKGSVTFLYLVLYSERDYRLSCEMIVDKFCKKLFSFVPVSYSGLLKSSFFSGSALHVFSHMLVCSNSSTTTHWRISISSKEEFCNIFLFSPLGEKYVSKHHLRKRISSLFFSHLQVHFSQTLFSINCIW